MQQVAAIVLAGGRNTGFGVLTLNRAKAALPYAGHYRIVDFGLSSLSDSGISHVGLIIQFLPGSLVDHVGTGEAWDFDGAQRRLKIMPPFVGVKDTEWYLGTADALRRNKRFFMRPDHFRGVFRDVVICSGEHVYAFDFARAIDFHRAMGGDLTVVAKRMPADRDSRRFGRLEFDAETRRVKRFVEKPDVPFSDWISIGIYLFRAEALDRALGNADDAAAPMNLAKDVVETVAAEGRTFAYPFDGHWEYIEDLGEYYRSHRALLASEHGGDSPVWDTRTNLLDRGLGSRVPAFLSPSCDVAGSIVSPGCVVHGRVVDSVLSPGVYVGPGAEVVDSILLHDTRVEAGASLRRVVCDKDAFFCPGCRIGQDAPNAENDRLPTSARGLAVFGKGCLIGPGVRLPAGSQVYPAVQLEAGDPMLQTGQTNFEGVEGVKVEAV